MTRTMLKSKIHPAARPVHRGDTMIASSSAGCIREDLKR